MGKTWPVLKQSATTSFCDAPKRESSENGVLSPQLQHPDAVLDSVEALVARSGLNALTIRALTTAAGCSNGAIYRTYGSRGGLIGRMWIRAERRFLTLLNSQVAQAHNPFDAVLAAAEASISLLDQYPRSAAVLFTTRREEVLNQSMSPELGDQLRALDQELVEFMSRLAIGLWKRHDADAVGLVRVCVLDLPKRIALRNMRFVAHTVKAYLRGAVGAILEVGPPPLVGEDETTPEEAAYCILL
ncbi:hypothetical protein MSIMFB_02746 [Mycobacterium simulans]|uniref:HTH tetR-type domain-containing protein n=1 Tax=Mycobacterium simulans TaxID=627089 RepID=A0A7Z7IKH5_9MYCO|nr:hypothetical protein MSIMFB_02746 [Mycobacterium simulans]